VELVVTNRGVRRRREIAARDVTGRDSVSVTIPPLDRGGSATLTYRLPGQRRGVWTIGPLRVGRVDPLGLARAAEAVGPSDELIVHPRTFPVVALPLGRAKDLDGPTSAASPQGGIAFHSLRPYTPGDDHRLIHWRSTARTGTLMVRHNVDATQPRTLVVLDVRQELFDGDGFEAAVEAAASIVRSSQAAGFPVVLETTDPAGRHHPQLMAELAAVQPRAGVPLATAIGRPLLDGGGWSLAVVTGRAAPEELAAVSRLAGRFGVAVVTRIGERIESRPPTGDVVFLQAATGEQFSAAWDARLR
jgi:uncharacterized protein (DUF58 family)